MNIKTIFPSPYLSADDLGDRRVEVTIARCKMEEFHNRRTNRKEAKLTVAFERASKFLVCNKTQAFAIARIAGSLDTDGWTGKRIALRVGVAPNNMPTIVVEAPAVQAPAEQLSDGEPVGELHGAEDDARIDGEPASA